jgi:hypothetical protein
VRRCYTMAALVVLVISFSVAGFNVRASGAANRLGQSAPASADSSPLQRESIGRTALAPRSRTTADHTEILGPARSGAIVSSGTWTRQTTAPFAVLPGILLASAARAQRAQPRGE